MVLLFISLLPVAVDKVVTKFPLSPKVHATVRVPFVTKDEVYV